MQKITLILFIVFSQVIFSASKITETDKLFATCKVWDFLKYYHPEVAGGKVNCDNQLLEKLPKIEKAQTKGQFGVYYPDKRETQRIGIIPDIEVKPTIKGIREGKDEVIDRALLFIETGK